QHPARPARARKRRPDVDGPVRAREAQPARDHAGDEGGSDRRPARDPRRPPARGGARSMNRIRARAVKWGVVVTAGAGIAALAASGAHAIVLDVYLLCIGAVVLLALVRTTRARAPVRRGSQFDA